MTEKGSSRHPPKRSAGIKRSPIKKKSRSKADFARIYGSKQRVEFVKSLPCAACGVVGYSENAHVAPASEKGTGYKAGFEWIVPLCGYRQRSRLNYNLGCHEMMHAFGMDYFARSHPDFNPAEAAAQTEKLWREHEANA